MGCRSPDVAAAAAAASGATASTSDGSTTSSSLSFVWQTKHKCFLVQKTRNRGENVPKKRFHKQRFETNKPTQKV
jgi:hypothetical protein